MSDEKIILDNETVRQILKSTMEIIKSFGIITQSVGAIIIEILLFNQLAFMISSTNKEMGGKRNFVSKNHQNTLETLVTSINNITIK